MGRKCLAFTAPDGGVSIIRPVAKMRREDETETAFLARVLAENIRIGKQPCAHGKRHEAGSYPTEADSVTIVDEDEIPVDLTYREAWVLAGGKPQVDMARAKIVHRDRLRSARKALFAENDAKAAWAVLTEDEALKAEALAERQRLRDLPAQPSIDAAQTPDELKAIRAQDRPSK